MLFVQPDLFVAKPPSTSAKVKSGSLRSCARAIEFDVTEVCVKHTGLWALLLRKSAR
jgi:hypothetical protein